MDEVRRSGDDELCGFIDEQEGRWRSRNVFGAMLSEHGNETDARDRVLTEGLASLTERWTLVDGTTGREEVACILEASPSEVIVARGYYALPGVPTLIVTAEQLASGKWKLHR